MQKNLPNLLTFLRIALIPFLVASFYMWEWFPETKGQKSHWIAASLFALAGITDFFDGYLARAWKVDSKIGRLFDPIADKLLVATAIVLLVHFDRADIIPSLIIICREIFVSGLREFLAEINVRVPVSRLAKIKTAVQMLAIFLLILGTAGSGAEWTELVGNTLLWIAALLTLVTGYSYLRAGLKHT